jgi:hypothetical protein
MPGAHVTSTDALESFRTNLIVYLGKTRPLLEDACDEVIRARQWLQQDRRLHWENQVRRRTRDLENANQALYSARLANLREVTTAEQNAVLRAKRALTEAEEKLRLVKRWTLEFDQRVGPLVKQLEQLRTMLSNDMPKAALHLAQVLKTLDAYANVAPSIESVVAPAGAATGSDLEESVKPESAPPIEGKS